MPKSRCFRVVVLFLCALMAETAISQEAAPPESAAPSAETAAATAGAVAETRALPPAAEAALPKVESVTMMMMLRWGGPILWVTMALGFLAFVMALYFLMTVTPKREVPATLAKRVVAQIRAGDLRGAYQLCDDRDEILANVVRAGLKMAGHDRYVIQDAMESEGERGVTALWQKITYLNNIGTIAPLLGLLGTVWGMVLAFSGIATDSTQVKSMVIAENVSKALITTVGGLVVAIPSMAVYYYLRGRVIKIVAEVEAHASEVVELLTRGEDR